MLLHCSPRPLSVTSVSDICAYNSLTYGMHFSKCSQMYSNHIILACACTLTWEMDDFLNEITQTIQDFRHSLDTLSHFNVTCRSSQPKVVPMRVVRQKSSRDTSRTYRAILMICCRHWSIIYDILLLRHYIPALWVFMVMSTR